MIAVNAWIHKLFVCVGVTEITENVEDKIVWRVYRSVFVFLILIEYIPFGSDNVLKIILVASNKGYSATNGVCILVVKLTRNAVEIEMLGVDVIDNWKGEFTVWVGFITVNWMLGFSIVVALHPPSWPPYLASMRSHQFSAGSLPRKRLARKVCFLFIVYKIKIIYVK
jgi:hypothetical protein